MINPNTFYNKFNLSVPVNPWIIACGIDIKVTNKFTFERLGYSGEITWENNRSLIWINPVDPPYRQKFVLSHLLGHYFLHPYKSFRDDIGSTLLFNNRGNIEEWEANNFALQVMIPMKELLLEIDKIIENYKSKRFYRIIFNKIPKNLFVKELSKIFDVTGRIMQKRLEDMKILKNKRY